MTLADRVMIFQPAFLISLVSEVLHNLSAFHRGCLQRRSSHIFKRIRKLIILRKLRIKFTIVQRFIFGAEMLIVKSWSTFVVLVANLHWRDLTCIVHSSQHPKDNLVFQNFSLSNHLELWFLSQILWIKFLSKDRFRYRHHSFDIVMILQL